VDWWVCMIISWRTKLMVCTCHQCSLGDQTMSGSIDRIRLPLRRALAGIRLPEISLALVAIVRN